MATTNIAITLLYSFTTYYKCGRYLHIARNTSSNFAGCLWLYHTLQQKTSFCQRIQIGTEHPVISSHLSTYTTRIVGTPESFGEVAAHLAIYSAIFCIHPCRSRCLKAGMSNRESKPPTFTQDAAHCMKCCADISNIHQGHIANRAVKRGIRDRRNCLRVIMQVDDTQRFHLFVTPGIFQHFLRYVNANDACSHMRKLPGNDTLPTGKIADMFTLNISC